MNTDILALCISPKLTRLYDSLFEQQALISSSNLGGPLFRRSTSLFLIHAFFFRSASFRHMIPGTLAKP